MEHWRGLTHYYLGHIEPDNSGIPRLRLVARRTQLKGLLAAQHCWMSTVGDEVITVWGICGWRLSATNCGVGKRAMNAESLPQVAVLQCSSAQLHLQPLALFTLTLMLSLEYFAHFGLFLS